MYPKTRISLMLLGTLGLTGLLLLGAGLSLALAQGGIFTRVTIASADGRLSLVPSLSADGTKVAFYSDSDFLNQGIPANQFEIWLYDTATVTMTRVTTASHSGRDSIWPSLSADGTKVAFYSNSDFLNQGIPASQTEIWLYDTTTMTLTRVTSGFSSSDNRNFNLNADGTKVAFYSDSDFLNQGIPANQDEIWLYDTATMTVTRVTTASPSGRGSLFPSLSADGTKVAFQSDSDFLNQGIPANQDEIWLYDTTTMTVTRVTTASSSGRRSMEPSLSADGSKVVFYSDSDFLNQGIPANQFEIWLYDTATMTLTRVTTASASDRYSVRPRLNADGSKVAFFSDSDFLNQGIPANQSEAWLYDTTAMILTRVTTASANGRDSGPAGLSADGTKIAIESDSDFLNQGIPASQFEIWLVNLDVEITYLPIILKNG